MFGLVRKGLAFLMFGLFEQGLIFFELVGRLRMSKAKSLRRPDLFFRAWKAFKLEKSLKFMAGTTWVRRIAQFFSISP